MKVQLGRGITWAEANRFECKRGKPQPGKAFCFTIQSKGTHSNKRSVIEFRAGRQVIGYQGPGCRLVYDRKDAREFDYNNTVMARFAARECIVENTVYGTKDPAAAEARAFRRALKALAKKAKTPAKPKTSSKRK